MTCCPHCGKEITPTPAGLTRMQRDLLAYITAFIADRGYSPTYEEMGAHLNLVSKSGIHRLVLGLEERGKIVRRPHLPRSIDLVRAA